MDCHFGCYYGGRSSSDGTPAPANAAAAGNAVVNAAVDTSDTSSRANTSFEKWRPAVIGLLIANLVIALALVAFNVIGRWSSRHRSTTKALGHTPTRPGLYRPVHKQDHDHDMEEVSFRSPLYS
ncbi:hypothetical protein DL96DRAFT_1716575 [Flagelloscypha sp. PMI_526]|nr:hypothetical protein DL96DRAFT_1716575 [Flagelloscypha sp. PMI_526]